MEKEISHYDYSVSRNLTTTYFTDGSFDTAAGDVRPKKEEVISDDLSGVTASDVELGFYKVLQPIPYTDEEGNEIGTTEVGSIQEVPVTLGDEWVVDGLAEVAEDPEVEEEIKPAPKKKAAKKKK